MEPISFASFSLAALLASLPTPGEPVSKSVISTHSTPAIAGQWEINLEEAKARDAARAAETTEQAVDMADAAITIQESSKLQVTGKAMEQGSCRELYNFSEDNNMWAVSGAEWTYGKYLVTHPEQGLPIIAIKTVYDNNEVDCAGNQIDQTDEALVAYLNHKDNKMQWCADPEGEDCFASFKRILP
jgi:hypothetical protein